MNEGFGVVGIDGLKIEPLPDDARRHRQRRRRADPRLERDLPSSSTSACSKASAACREYGITVRWDKNFLTLLYLTLARRRGLRMYGGVRFGGTLTIEDAWSSASTTWRSRPAPAGRRSST